MYIYMYIYIYIYIYKQALCSCMRQTRLQTHDTNAYTKHLTSSRTGYNCKPNLKVIRSRLQTAFWYYKSFALPPACDPIRFSCKLDTCIAHVC